MSECIVALDAGGTAVKAAAYDRHGRELASAGAVMAPLRPRAGFNERDPDLMWETLCRLVRTVMTQGGIAARDVAAVGLTGYGNGLLLVDGEGRPVRNAILSSDQRAADVVSEWCGLGLETLHLEMAFQRLWAGKPLPLLAWLERHEPETVARARHLLMCKDFLRMRLTGRFALEVGDASSGSLLDQRGRHWTPAVIDHLGLGHHAGLFGEVLEPLVVAGGVTDRAAAETGLRPGTPVSAGYADGPSMLLALGITDGSRLNVIAGTWGLNQLLTPRPVVDGSILASMLGPRPGEYVLVDGGATSASTFEWFVETIAAPAAPAGVDPYHWCNECLTSLGDDDPPVYFLPWLNGRLDEARARGCFVGLSSWHAIPHLVRAVFEGVALEHRRHVGLLLAGQPRPEAARFAGGAARSPAWLKIFAAALDMPIEVGEAKELGALGAAILASVAAGIHPDLETAVARMTRVALTVSPNPAEVEVMARRADAYGALRDALAPAWPVLARGC